MWQRELVDELKNAKPAERKKIVTRYAGLRGYSPEHIYRIARQHGFSSGRKARSDKGECTLAKEQLDFVAAFLQKTRRENKGVISPVENALEFAIDNGIILRGEVSVSHLQKLLRDRQMNKKQLNAPTPHTQMASLYPNHVHEVDVSTCIQYYLDDGGLGLQRMPDDEFYKNKVENFKKVKQVLQRYIIEDHFSGFFFVKYYVAAGENKEDLFDFLISAWGAKADPRMPFRGAPNIILADGGMRAKAKALGIGFWDGLDIEIPPGEPGNSRRQGGAECHHNIWEMWFETRLRVDPATTIEDLNRKAFGFCLWFNATRKHTRHGMTRLSCWLMIRQEQLREIPSRAELQDLLNKPEITRTVSGGEISVDGKEFRLHSFGIPHGSQVTVIKNIWKWKEGIITVAWQNQRYEVKAIEKLPPELGGFRADSPIIGQGFRSNPETATQQAVKRMNQLAHGTTDPGKKDIPFYGLNAFEGFADKVDNVAVFPRRGTQIELVKPAPVQLPIMEVLKRVRAELGSVSPQLNRRLREELGETVPADLADTVIAQIAETGDFRLDQTAAAQAL